MAKVTSDDDEPVGYRFYPQPDLYCSYCGNLVEPEYLVQYGPCHTCGEWSVLYKNP